MANDHLTMCETGGAPYSNRRVKIWLVLAIFFVTTLPQTRIVLGPVPFYLVDGFLLALLGLSLNRTKSAWEKSAKRLVLI